MFVASSPSSSSNSAAFFGSSISKGKKSTVRPMVVAMSSCGTAAAASTKGPADYYKLLSVSGGAKASGEDIKRAYRAMALQYHPDRVCDPLLKEQCTRMFVQLNAAYKTLSDPALRREYDDSMMGLKRSSFGADRDVWESQIFELKRRSALQRDRAAAVASWGGRMRDRNCWGKI